MKKQDILFVVSLVAVWGGLYSKLAIEEATVIATNRETIKGPESLPALENVAKSKIAHSPSVGSRHQPQSLPLQTAPADSLGVFKAPSTPDLQSEVAAQPHSAPLGLLTFAEQVSKWFTSAEGSVPVAEELMSHMESCLDSGENLPLAIQAYCWETAARLSTLHHGQLKGRFDHLDQRVSPQTRKLLDLYRSLKPSAS
ncbi:MAG: hypothetical protein K2X47_04215 [Bdellovibrionales bacterium]|nr:hypothetical protein [Bdellovibrionales bacterium]